MHSRYLILRTLHPYVCLRNTTKIENNAYFRSSFPLLTSPRMKRASSGTSRDPIPGAPDNSRASLVPTSSPDTSPLKPNTMRRLTASMPQTSSSSGELNLVTLRSRTTFSRGLHCEKQAMA
ncbi:hypothetical protein BDP55DRAFT_639840 [Colletotrichum godetiae]|uniref:Uncharacterized protein n=1 Tax=Colletotrichum godetiae TaxID=1209918 RepID=A0AAJ0EZ52_9PEZI|nr:uncharacterized protein BDP55DRAFT_639840 [Colletotrichum godetiae]KAK1700889.1 hypothetical protein BDP55DRAFT_639840 [Colletotrichum godetiae]